MTERSRIAFDVATRSQPERLASSAAAVRGALGSLPPLGDGPIVLTAIGASAHAAADAAVEWRRAGLRAIAVPAAELAAAPLPGASTVVAISQSGRSVETLAALAAAGTAVTVALTDEPASPLAERCDVVVALGVGLDSAAHTVGYTTTLQALGLIGDHWSGRRGGWSELPELAATVLGVATGPAAELGEALAAARAVEIVAAVGHLGSAGEGALLLRECARVPASAHETRSYLHGPIESAEPGLAAVVLGAGRELRLAADLARFGCPTLLVTATPSPAHADAPDLSLAGAAPAAQPVRIAVPSACGLAANVLEILPLQLLTAATARARGVPDGSFRAHQDDTKLEAAPRPDTGSP
jgi:fructoselysine-6-P-deglycase FrlB-like protein